ncbi:hypothetical protein [Clostridium rectalis]|uniref:hypothetical protein n=1 Tax=Clostridium rectalis TaxID=2040295 RepID=UPI000F63C18E|nr:hypothetical protein [Clostridium rectalis]
MDMILNSYKKKFSYDILTEGTYLDNGDYVPGSKTTKMLEGALLPLNEKDITFLPGGVYSSKYVKLYTDVLLKENTKILDVETSEVYTIYAYRDYNIIDTYFKRYYMKKEGKING